MDPPRATTPNVLLSSLSRKQLLYCKILGELTVHSSLLTQLNEEFDELKRQMNTLFQELRGPEIFGPTFKHTLLNMLVKEPFPVGFSLDLKSTLANPICRGRYIIIEICLIAHFFPLPPDQFLSLDLQFYTAEDVPKRITTNFDDQPLLKGRTTVFLAFNSRENMHTATFKVQFNEVTSHFRNGWVFLAVVPECSHFLRQVGYLVKPLVIEHFVVKARTATCDQWRKKGIVHEIGPTI